MAAPSYSSLLRVAVSSDRFSAYAHPGDSPEQTAGRYLWNMALSEALYPVLQTLEVAFRNSLHASITTRLGTRWFENSSLISDDWARAEVTAAKQRLTRLGRAHDPGRVIATLPFGFWTDLLHIKYEQAGRKRPPSSSLWPFLLRIVFPHAPRQGTTRSSMSTRMEGLRDLRNRTFHYEPIMKGRPDYNRRVVPLESDHTDILETIGWISPALADAAALIDRFSVTYRYGPDHFAQLVRDHCRTNNLIP